MARKQKCNNAGMKTTVDITGPVYCHCKQSDTSWQSNPCSPVFSLTLQFSFLGSRSLSATANNDRCAIQSLNDSQLF